MAAKLQCEICGGKLVGKPGGIFECDSCGTEYSTAWAKEKIQEIQGTVKVEGTVEVKGSVQVEGSANVQSLIKRGNLALEDRKYDEAEKCFNDVLNADPENAEAYLGLAMAKLKCYSKYDFIDVYSRRNYVGYVESELNRASQFGDEELKEWIRELEEKRAAAQAEIEKKKAEEKAEKERKEAKEKEKEQAKLNKLKEKRKQIAPYQGLIAAGGFHTVGVKEDGRVIAIGDNGRGQCKVSDWNDITAVAAAGGALGYTVGLKSDRNAVAVGFAKKGQCDVSSWRDIIAVSAGWDHTVGLKANRTVVAVGDNENGKCDVSGWNNIVAVDAGFLCTVGVKSNGDVVFAGAEGSKMRHAAYWSDIVAISAGQFHIVGLKSDGTVETAGSNSHCQCDVYDWEDIVAVAAGNDHTIGLKADGTVVATGNNEYDQCDVLDWKDIIAISTNGNHTLGLRADGTVISTGANRFLNGMGKVSNWKLFRTDEDFEADYNKACKLQNSNKFEDLKQAVELFRDLKDYNDSAKQLKVCEVKLEAATKNKLNTEKLDLQTELANLKGIFSGKRRKEIEARLAQIDNELKKL